MGRSLLAAALALALLAPPGAAAAPPRAGAAKGAATLEESKADLAALLRDPARRRYRHNWERVIGALLAAAKGKDAAAATLEAARARQALHRWSAREDDRRKALILADRAARMGSREAASLARELRAEAAGNGGAAKRAPPPPSRRAASAFEEAEAAMSAIMRDRQKRRYRHNWERGISGLLRAAKGRDAAPATLEAARARYALYRWSANEEDRDKALVLADRAARMGAREAPALARAIRREAGEDHPPRAPARSAPAPEAEEEPPSDPALEDALADLSAAAPDAAPSLPLGKTDGPGAAHVSEVRTWSSDDYSRVAVYLSHWVGWQKLELPAGPDGPRRIALDLRPAVLDGGARATSVPGAQVDRVRVAQNDPETVRVVLDLPGADRVELFALDDPPRLVLDVGTHPAPAAPPPVAVTEPGKPQGQAAAQPAGGGDEADARRPVRRVVVDAGHGGHDPGAIGPRRVREKDVTLAIARRVARRLRAQGFEVVLTRSDDRYLALEERTAIANTARGDLFVSIHANAHPQRGRRGVETYVLDVAHDRYAARLAARENGLDLGGTREVARILADLDAKASAGPSGRLARLVQREVTTGIRAHVGEVRDIGVKSALFYVLLGARMPAVLVETGFISNREEERRLASPRYQDEVAAGIARAVSAFAQSEERVAAR